MIPARDPRAELMANEKNTIRFTSMPTSPAARRFAAQARIAFPVMLEKLSGGITFLIFALICLANLLYVLKYVPETKGKTLEKLEKQFAK